MMKLLETDGLVDELALESSKLMRLLARVEKGYLASNPCTTSPPKPHSIVKLNTTNL